MPTAMGRSNAAPTFRTSAGARLTVMRSSGNGNPLFLIAARTRSRLSRTVASGNPTMVSPGNPGDTSTSTTTGTASIPIITAAETRASMRETVASAKPTESPVRSPPQLRQPRRTCDPPDAPSRKLRSARSASPARVSCLVSPRHVT